MSNYREQAIVFCIVVCTTASQYAWAMQNDGVRLRAETRVVQIDVIVTDANGKPVTDLSKQDFSVTDDSKPRVIDIFSINRGEIDPAKSALPEESSAQPAKSPGLPPDVFSNRSQGPPNLAGHSTVIVLDQDSYNPIDRKTFEDAAYGQLQVIDLMSKVKPDEEIALYVIAKRTGLLLLQDHTTNRDLLLRSLRNYVPRAMSTPAETHPDKPSATPGPKRRDPNEVPIRETESLRVQETREVRLSFQALAAHLALVPGRKSVFWVSEGFSPQRMRGMEQMAWSKTIAALNEANVAVNAIDERGLTTSFRPPNALEEVALQTGGLAWYNRNDLDNGMAEGIEAARVTYTLAFYLADSERDNTFHTLKVKADRPGLQLYYRQGYYAGDTDLPPEKGGKGELESALLNQVDANGVGITARVDSVPGNPQGIVNVRLNLDPGTLSLKEQGTGWTGQVEETFIEMNETGATLSKISDTKQFEVARANRAEYDAHGVTWPFAIPFMKGATKVTIVVRDSKTGRVGSLTIPLH